jgi:hypothetical protein
MSRTKYDPLEAAKIGADGEKPKAPAPTFTPPAPTPARVDVSSSKAKPVEIDISDVEEEVTPPSRPAPTPPAPMRVVPVNPRYRILEAGRVSWDGQIFTLAKGSIIDSGGYGGEPGISRLRAQGVKLEPVQS